MSIISHLQKSESIYKVYCCCSPNTPQLLITIFFHVEIDPASLDDEVYSENVLNKFCENEKGSSDKQL